MRTLVLVLIGIALAVAVWRFAPPARRTTATILFTAVWLALSAWNLNTGMSHGYTLAQELPIHAVLFGVPTLVAWLLWRRGR